MKKISVYFGIIAAAALTLVSCAKEINDPNFKEEIIEEGVPFEIVANPQTKTTIDGLQTAWAADDGINLFHAVAGSTTYVDDGEFTIASADLAAGTFKGTLASAPSSGTYDWYAVYPYNEYLHTVDNNPATPARFYIGKRSDQAQEQTGNSSTAHLAGTNYPLFGKVAGVAYDATPSVTLAPIASFIEIKVTNKTETPLTVTSVSFTAPEGSEIVGQYEVHFDTTPITFTKYKTYVSDVANLTVTDGTPIAKNAYATFYIGVKPFSTTSGDVIKVSVNGQEKAITTTKDFTFQAGKMKTVNFDYEAVVDYVTLDWDYAGGTSSDLNAVDGVTTSGLGTDYGDTNAPYQVKFDTSEDYIQVKTDASIGTVSVSYKMIGGKNTSYLNIFESTDGSSWGERIDRLTISGTQNSTGTLTTTASFNSASRYVKIVFEKGSNVGIGAISIHKPSTSPVITANDITNVPAAGVTDADWTYVASNFVDDVEVASVTGCVTEAIADDGDIVYSVAPNYTTTAKDGTIVLWSAADHSVTKTINVAQLKSTLTVSALTVTIPASSNTSSFTVTTAEFGYNAVVASTEAGMNLSISSGATGSASASAQTVTVASTTEAPTSGDPITLGTISVYRNGNTSDTQLKTITIKKAVSSGSGSGPAAGTVLWTDTFGTTWGGTTTTFTDQALLSTYDYAGRSGYLDNTDVTLTADSNNVRGTKSSGGNCTGSHLWFNKSTNATVTTSEIRLYEATSLVLTYDQGTKDSSLTAGYSTDGGTNWTDFDASGAAAGNEYSFTVDPGTVSIILRFVHSSSNAKNTRFDNPKLAVGD